MGITYFLQLKQKIKKKTMLLHIYASTFESIKNKIQQQYENKNYGFFPAKNENIGLKTS